MYVELVLDVVKVVAGAGAELVGGREVESGGYEKIGDVFRRNIARPGRVVSGGAGDL